MTRQTRRFLRYLDLGKLVYDVAVAYLARAARPPCSLCGDAGVLYVDGRSVACICTPAGRAMANAAGEP